METYTVTGFENDGTLVLNEMFEASDDQSAKQQGLDMLRAVGHEHKGARITRRGELIYFERCKLPGKLDGTAS